MPWHCIALGGSPRSRRGACGGERIPRPAPTAQRFWVQAPHPVITRDRLREILEPHRGERILEVGPGTGYYTLDMAEWVGPGGHGRRSSTCSRRFSTTRWSARRSAELETIEPTRWGRESMPYEDESFDAAC